MCFAGGGKWDRPRSLNSIIKFYGVASTMARGGVGDRTTAVVFRHLASFSEPSRRKEVWTAEQVRSGKRVQEIREWEKSASGGWMRQETRTSVHSAHRYGSISVITLFLLFPTSEKLDAIKTWNGVQIKSNWKLIYCLYKFNNKWFPSFLYTTI